MKVKSLSHVRPSATPWTAALQAPPSMGFSRQEYWSGVPLPSPIVYPQINNTVTGEIITIPEHVFGESKGTPLQYSCLKNPMDGGAWNAAVHGVSKSQTRLNDYFHFSLSYIGEGNGNPLHCSCLENPRDCRAWWAAVYGIAQSWTRLR